MTDFENIGFKVAAVFKHLLFDFLLRVTGKQESCLAVIGTHNDGHIVVVRGFFKRCKNIQRQLAYFKDIACLNGYNLAFRLVFKAVEHILVHL